MTAPATQSPELTKFYDDYWAWLQAGAPDGEPFRRWRGLCFSFLLDSSMNDDVCELERQFEDAGLSKLYPFGEAEYRASFRHDAMHLDPQRIAWVDAHRSKP